MWKKGKKALALLLAAFICAGSIPAQAAEVPAQGKNPTAVAGDEGPVIDFNMDSMQDGAVINAADSQAFQVLGNTPVLVDGKDGHGKALQFDGSTNYINLGTDYQFKTGQLTISAWVKIDSNPNGLSRVTGRARTGVPDEKELGLFVRNNGRLESQCPNYAESATGAVPFETWQHIAVTNDGELQTLYINGELAATARVAGPVEQWDLGLLIGTCWNEQGTAPFAGHMFKGAMDDVKLYNRAVSEKEIKALADVADGGGDEGDVTLPDALYEFTMNEIKDGTGELAGKKVITSSDGTEYPIYGGAKVDDYGIYDKSIVFNGSDTYVNIGKPAINNTYTMSAWIHLEVGAANNLNKVFGRDRTTISDRMFYIAVRGDSGREGTVEAALDGGGAGGGPGTVPFGEWANLAVTNTPEKSCLYVNGNLVSTGGGSSKDQGTHPLDMLIGCGYNAGGTGIFNGHAFKGRMDDVRIYDVALTAAQVKKNTEGIFDKLPPEINRYTPAQGQLISPEGKVTINYNMALTLGDQPVAILDDQGGAVKAALALKDEDEKIDGAETLVIVPENKLTPGKTYTYKIPAGAVVNEKGVGNLETAYTYSVARDLEGDAAESGMEYWAVSGKLDLPSSITEENGKVTITNGLVKRTFDLNQNFLTVDYENLYTGIHLLDNNNLQADVRMTLNDTYEDGDSGTDTPCFVGGVDNSLPTFQYTGYSVENKVVEPFHWEYDERISPPSMKDAKWPADGKALVVNFEAPKNIDSKYAGVKVQVRYEIYDGIPVISKSVNVTNEGNSDVIVHRLTTEALPVPISLQDALFMDSDMNMGNNNHDRNNGQYLFRQWEDVTNASGMAISRYAIDLENQVNMQGLDNNNFGPDYRLKKGESFTSYKLYELFRSSSYFEWQTLEVKKMYRVLFPQSMDAPLIYHCISSDPATLRNAIDQAANAGFTMVLMSFGSGINTENTDPAYMARYKEICDYAHSKGILVGAYMMLTARGGGETHGGIWGTMRCINSDASHDTMERTLVFVENTGLDCLEIDGSYPGSLCELTDHKGHEGIEDSVVKQWEAGVREYYKELRKRNVYINAPDWHYMAGANMGVMGYAESGFSVTPLEQLIYGRAMSYYGTFEKLPAMGWTLVPLSAYGGGSDSSFWPYNEKIMEYDFMVGMNMLYGIIGSYRGGSGLYQEGPAQNVMETWGEFYNRYREILGGDIIHIAPPLPVDINSNKTKAIDGFLHVSAENEQKGLAAFFNQTGETVTQTVTIPLYYTGLTDLKSAPAPLKDSHYRITDPTRTSGPVGHMGGNREDRTPSVPDIPNIAGVPTDKKAFVCLGDMDGREYVIDSNGNIEVELTMEPNTYTWLTVYDPNEVPTDLPGKADIAVPENLAIKGLTSSEVTLAWDAVSMEGRDVKEYHIYRDGEYLGKTFKNEYKDATLEADKNYSYEVAAVHNTVSGEKAEISVSTVADTTAPQIASTKAAAKNQITITFDEFVDETSAQTAANFAVENNTVTSAVLGHDGKTVTLTLQNAMTPFVRTAVTVNNVTDLAGNKIAQDSKAEVVFGNLRKFKFDEADGNVAKDSIDGIDGSIAGDNVVRKDGVSGTGLYFDGGNTFVDIGNVVKTLNEYSISGWFQPESVDGVQTIAAQQRDSYDGWRWSLTVEDGALKFVVNNGKGTYPGNSDGSKEIAVTLSSGAKKAAANNWNHFALVRNGDTFTLYLNGEKADSETKAGIDQSQSIYTMWLGGCRNNAGGEPMNQFKGLMDEVRFYNTPVSDDFVKNQYEENKPKELDKAALTALIEKFDREALYTPASWAEFAPVLQGAKDALADEGSVQSDLDAAYTDLLAAALELVERPNKNGLKALIDEAEALDTGDCRPGKVKDFEKALAAAQKTYGDPNADLAAVNAATDTLLEAMLNLKDIVDRTELSKLVSLLEKLDETQYFKAGFDKLKEAIAQAKLLDDDASVKQVEDAYKALQKAYGELVRLPDKTALENAVKNAETILKNRGDYMPSTIAGLDELTQKAKAVLNKPEATIDEVTAELNSLTQALAKVRVKEDRTALLNAIDRANKLDAEKYTAESYAFVKGAAAKAVLTAENGDATKAEIENALADLNGAMDNLVLLKDDNNGGSGSGGDGTTDVPKTGASAPGGVLALTAFSLAALWIFRKKNHDEIV